MGSDTVKLKTEGEIVTFGIWMSGAGSENVAESTDGETVAPPVATADGSEKVADKTEDVAETFSTAVTVEAGSENVPARTVAFTVMFVTEVKSLPASRMSSRYDVYVRPFLLASATKYAALAIDPVL